MKTLRMLGDRKSEVVEVPDLDPKDDLVVVKIMASAVCGSEHSLYEAAAPLAARNGGGGHEGAGIVWKVDKARHAKEGDRVTVAPMPAGCGQCIACAQGNPKHCENKSGWRSDGGTHTQYMRVPEGRLLAIPDFVCFDSGAILDDCIGTPYRAINRLGVRAGQTVLITGAGPIGAAAAIIAKFRNATVIVVDINDYRLEQAKNNGADHILNPEREDALARVREISGGGVPVSVECSGQASAQTLCLDAARANGRVAMLGIRNEIVSVNMFEHFVKKELTLVGSWASTFPEHFEIIELVRKGMPVDRLITHSFGMDDAPAAITTFFEGQAVKTIIQPWGEASLK